MAQKPCASMPAGNVLVGGTTTPETTGLSIETTSSTGGLNIISPNTGRGDYLLWRYC